MNQKKTGKIIQVIGPVIDVGFDNVQSHRNIGALGRVGNAFAQELEGIIPLLKTIWHGDGKSYLMNRFRGRIERPGYIEGCQKDLFNIQVQGIVLVIIYPWAGAIDRLEGNIVLDIACISDLEGELARLYVPAAFSFRLVIGIDGVREGIRCQVQDQAVIR